MHYTPAAGALSMGKLHKVAARFRRPCGRFDTGARKDGKRAAAIKAVARLPRHNIMKKR